MTGVINVYKEKDYTSHDVVAVVRKFLRQEYGKIKIGHTGTLDPQAEGVLPICIGRATKIAANITADSKTYRAELILGLTTDTGDHVGKVIKTSEVKVTFEALEESVKSFTPGYMQIPPMYSALKINGKKLYELARQGKTVERQPRYVEIPRIDILGWNNNDRAWLDIDCGKGTYIRSLCEDIGQKLQTGGCMGNLVRTRSGAFNLDDAVTLSKIEQLIKDGRLQEVMHEPEFD